MDGDTNCPSHLGPPIFPRPPEIHGSQHVNYDSSAAISPPYRPPQLHHRSCTECCRRKVRCDHRHPCSNCAKARSECIFPKSRRAPVRQKNATRSRDEELLKSLRRLERRLQSTEILEPAQGQTVNNNCSEERVRLNEETRSRQSSTSGLSPSNKVRGKREEPARLVLDHDRSRYISNNFWTSMSREVSFDATPVTNHRESLTDSPRSRKCVTSWTAPRRSKRMTSKTKSKKERLQVLTSPRTAAACSSLARLPPHRRYSLSIRALQIF
jgi:hypothetical protein